MISGLERSVGAGIGYPFQYSWASSVAQLVKNLPTMRDTWLRSLGWEDPLEKGKATHSSILGIPWWLSWKRISLLCRRTGFDLWIGKIPRRRERLPTPVFWPGEFHGLCSPRGGKESDRTEGLSLSVLFCILLGRAWCYPATCVRYFFPEELPGYATTKRLFSEPPLLS